VTPKPLEQQVAELSTEVARLGRILAAIGAAFGVGPGAEIAPASDADLDSPYGDERIRCDPRDWKGTSRKNDVMSRCEPEFLDLYVGVMLHFAENNSADAQKSGYDRRAAARAMGWARRLRAGWRPKGGAAPKKDSWGRPVNEPAPAPETAFDGFDQGGDDEIPF